MGQIANKQVKALNISHVRGKSIISNGSDWIDAGLGINDSALLAGPFMPSLCHWGRWQASGTSSSTTGFAASFLGTSSDGIDNDGKWQQRDSAVTSGSYAGMETTSFTEFRSNHSPAFFGSFKTGADITTVRYLIGIFNSTPLSVDTQNQACAWLRFSTVASDTGLVPIVKDANGGTETVGSVIGTFAADTVYRVLVWIDFTNTKTYFSVNGSTPQAINAIPASGTNLGFAQQLVNTANGVRVIKSGIAGFHAKGY